MSASSARQPASSSSSDEDRRPDLRLVSQQEHPELRGPAGRAPTSSDEDRAAKRREKYRRYNSSAKGQARNLRYEAKHPERAVRWSPITGREVAAVAAAVANREPPR